MVVEKLEVRLDAPPLLDPEADEVRAAVAEVAVDLGMDTETLKGFARELDRVIREVARGDGEGPATGLDLTDDDTLAELLHQAVAGLDARLAGGAS